MMSYKQFMRDLSDDVEPDDAKGMYERYKSQYYMNNRSEYFRKVQDDPGMREKYDPRLIPEMMERRAQLAATAAEAFTKEMQEGRMVPDVVGDGSRGGDGGSALASSDAADADMNVDGAAGGSASKPARKLVPASSWSDERVSKDLAQAQRLVETLDAEKGIVGNPVHTAGGGDQDMGDAAEGATSSWIGKLDLLIEWLFRVHKLDYYGGKEGLNLLEAVPEERTVRPPRPHLEKSQGDTAVLGASFFDSLDSMWESRCRKGDPLREMLQEERVAKDMEEVVDRKISMVTDKDGNEYWRCKTCSKMFKGKEFVVKHVRNKHDDVLEEDRVGVLEKVYEDNFVRCEKVPGEVDETQMQQPGNFGGGPRQGLPYGGMPPMGMPFAMPMQPMMMGPGGFPMFPPFGAQQFQQQGGGGRRGGGKRGGNPAAKAAQAKAKEISRSDDGPKEQAEDPRKLNQYNDLDSASADVPVLDYRSLLL